MSIRIVEGLPAARAHIARLRSGAGPTLPPAVAQHLRQIFGRDLTAAGAVAQIVADVRRDGDDALRDYTRRIDGVDLEALAAGPAELEAAYRAAPAALRQALALAAERIRVFHRREPGQSWLEWDNDGGALGQAIRPLSRVGVYAPGGSAAYPSSLLMAAIPAQVAGVPDIVVTTPPGPGGTGSPAVLAAAHVLGLERVFLLGGAQAVAALAYGTGSVPRVDKVVGAGGLFVTLAKRQVYGDVGIDGLYGPTETLLVADESASPALAAADLLAQAEHDPDALPVLVTTDERLVREVNEELEAQLSDLPTRETASVALKNGYAVLVPDLDTARRVCDRLAPEHLELHIDDAETEAWRFDHYGGVFIGPGAAEVLGDYGAGPNHTLPTGGTARHTGGLSVLDFLRVRTWLSIEDPTAAAPLVRDAERLADLEGLTAHARAARWRL